MLKADEIRIQTRELSGLTVNITSYKIGRKYYCHIDNIDPGAEIAKTEGQSADEVITEAMNRAVERLTSKI